MIKRYTDRHFTYLVCNQPSRPTQPPNLGSVRSEYQWQCSSVGKVQGHRRSGVALVMRHRLSGIFSYEVRTQCLWKGDDHIVSIGLPLRTLCMYKASSPHAKCFSLEALSILLNLITLLCSLSKSTCQVSYPYQSEPHRVTLITNRQTGRTDYVRRIPVAVLYANED